MAAVIFTVCAAFNQTILFSSEGGSFCHRYIQAHYFVYVGRNGNHDVDMFIEIDRCSFSKCTCKHDRLGTALELNIIMLKAEAVETMFYSCVTCSYEAIHRAHHT